MRARAGFPWNFAADTRLSSQPARSRSERGASLAAHFAHSDPSPRAGRGVARSEQGARVSPRPRVRMRPPRRSVPPKVQGRPFHSSMGELAVALGAATAAAVTVVAATGLAMLWARRDRLAVRMRGSRITALFWFVRSACIGLVSRRLTSLSSARIRACARAAWSSGLHACETVCSLQARA
jgi:hypothetical protein